MSGVAFDPIDQEFVDRVPERAQYSKIADRSDNQRIFCLRAEDGWGKSWLLSRLYLDTPEKNCLKAMIDLGSTKVKNEQVLLETLAEEMGGIIAEQMLEAISSPLGDIHIQAGRDVNIEGDVALNKVVINHQGGSDHLSVELQDPYGYEQRVRNLTRLFRSGLEQLPSLTWAILFLDRFEKATEPTRHWLVDHLFTGMRNGEYSNLIIVVANTKQFDCFEGREWRYTVVEQQLSGLPEDSIREYWLQKRRLPETDLQTILKLLSKKGNSPASLSAFADMIESS